MRSNRLILLVGLLLAVLAFGGIVLLLQGGSSGSGNAQPSAPTKLPTVYATVAIPLGTTIKAGMLEARQIAIAERDPNALNSPDALLGATARADIPQGKQVTTADLGLNGVRGAITKVSTPKGLRAIAVQVDQLSGVGTVIDSGDWVDVVVSLSGDKLFPVVTFQKTTEEMTPIILAGQGGSSVKLIVQGVQVVGTALPPPPAPPTTGNQQPAPSASAATGATTLNEQNELVILAVTPGQAEIIRFAEVNSPDASVALVLRSPKDFVDDQGNPIVPPAQTTSGITLKTLIDKYGVLTPQVLQTILQRPETVVRK
ncbi:MAG TPA: Flp pilus assembly protein CpaB [Candidatus Limnocylindrales bacterium]